MPYEDAPDPDQESRLEDETRAAQRIFALLPEHQAKEYLELWLEFENRSTEEARFAAVVDGIQPLLNHVITGNPRDGVVPTEKVRNKKAYIKNYAPKLGELVEELIEESEQLGLYA